MYMEVFAAVRSCGGGGVVGLMRRISPLSGCIGMGVLSHCAACDAQGPVAITAVWQLSLVLLLRVMAVMRLLVVWMPVAVAVCIVVPRFCAALERARVYW